VQEKLRQSLREHYKDAVSQKRLPTPAEINDSRPAYLDAVVEENLRLAQVAPANARTATQDVEVLGYRIPAGTEVWMPVRYFEHVSMPSILTVRSTDQWTIVLQESMSG
jgi:cytochrome P450